MTVLDHQALHASLQDPVLESIGFLNEIMSRHPDAVSFAPGAPHPDPYADLDPTRYLDRFVAHAAAEPGSTPARAARLLYEYGPARGIVGAVVADALRRDQGIDADPDTLVITVGAQEAMLLTLRALIASPNDLLAVTDPCFVGITSAASLLGAEVVPVPEDDRDGLDIDALAEACRTARRTGRRIRACYVAPDYANPSGSRMEADRRRRLLELAEREDFLVLEDNAYGFTAAPGTELPALKALDTARRVVHIGTFAKVCFPGARVGYVVADQSVRTAAGTVPLAAELARLKTAVTVNTSPMCQALVAGMLLEHGGSLAELSRTRSALYRRNLAHLLRALDRESAGGLPDGVEWNRPGGGFFVRMRLPVPADAALLEVCAAEYGVLWTPMAPFHPGGGGTHSLRLSCSYLDPDRIDEGARRLVAFLRARARARARPTTADATARGARR
ncbi:PLP-dependent aminotransferase family protein [Streptomyces sp. NBC_00249]|uniref:aminotransferase-like domain-containing protein n=1 Tax=Streptomyces sp. NBC_00249 TaxID=2975690 RepID=UPI0022529A3F|nr:PLP-dependent aminotransferase family protein [Streptomyces sp. NBC_00249]MCX5195629.1 PLP-dependent aminotransferase family protein [Streptomyces sp. NBC_00249]